MAKGNNKIGYFPELDAIRTIAVALTLSAHFIGRVGFKEFNYLWLGVDVFFVLSGFLITGILLRSRSVNPGRRLKEVCNFFVRRALRLFPAYYLLITVFFLAKHLLSLYIWNDHYNAYFFLYLPNWFFFFNPGEASGSFNHMWSLGVEEQFYLIWPWLMLFLPYKSIRFVLIGMIVLSLTLRATVYIPNFAMLPFCNFHTLAAGGLLAYYYFGAASNNPFGKLFGFREVIFLAVFCALLLVLNFAPQTVWRSLLQDALVAFGSVMLIICTISGWSKPMRFITANKAVQYLGRISYGIYLYHMPIPDTILALAKWRNINLNFSDHPYGWLTVFFGLSVLIAFLSYNLIEKPFLKLKQRFTLNETPAVVEIHEELPAKSMRSI